MKSNQTGFTLIEVMMALLVMSIGFVVLSTVMVMQAEEQLRMAEELEFVQLRELSRSVLRDQSASAARSADQTRCEKSLWGQAAPPTPPMTLDANFEVVLDALYFSGATPSNPPEYLVRRGEDYGRQLKICDLRLTPRVNPLVNGAGTGKQAVAKVQISYAPQKKGCADLVYVKHRTLADVALDLTLDLQIRSCRLE